MKHVFFRTNARWLDQLFSSKSAMRGGIVRRSVRWVEREIGREMLIKEVKRRGFHLVESGGQFVIFCHAGRLRMIA